MERLTDESIMYWGKYQGHKMKDIPGHYLLWLKENVVPTFHTDAIFDYINDNIEIIRKECLQRTKKW